jgi:hypothetical protein
MSEKPNPNQLINLPGAGNAEKELRKAGYWRRDQTEIIAGIIENVRYELETLEMNMSMEDKE